MKKQQGVALIAAIFLVVVIGAALVFLATLSLRNTQQTTQNLLQMRAQLAAQAGLDATVQRLVMAPGSAAWCNGAALTISVPVYAAYDVSVRCQQKTFNRPSQEIPIFELSATAEYGSNADPDYTWTEISATIGL